MTISELGAKRAEHMVIWNIDALRGLPCGGPAVISAAFTSQESLLLCLSKQKLNRSAERKSHKVKS